MRAATPDSRIDLRALDELAVGFRGDLIRPAESGYDELRRIWNGSVDRHPAVILRCAGVNDVRAAVGFARRTGMPVAVRGGRHSFPGHSATDGVAIDLSRLRGIRVDPVARTARAQAGVLLGELDAETQAFGLAVPSGIVTHTGLAGLTLGGGIGWLMRRHGLTIDQLLSVDLVTASGEFVTASADRNAELFWGVRGGGGNFGVVTEFEFALQPVGPEVYAGAVLWPAEDAPELIRFYREWIESIPDELTTAVVQRRIPPLPAIPPELHGLPCVMVIACHCGPVVEGAAALAPLKAFGTPLLDLCVPKPFLQHQAMFDPSFPHGRWYYTRSTDVDSLTDDVVDAAVSAGTSLSGTYSSYIIFHAGGAVSRVPADATAFGDRSSGHVVNIVGATDGPDGFDEQRTWVRRSWEEFMPHASGTYVNFLNDEGSERIKALYGAERYARLQSLKREYDPENLFRLNQNISPD
jgi:FAD/FMN-containing dehydrogenase